MHPAQLILPSIATLILGTAILLPLRDVKRDARDDHRRSASEPEWQTALDLEALTRELQPSSTTDEECDSDARQEPSALADAPARNDERIVPITRRRLRAIAERISWPSLEDPTPAPPDPDERLKHLTAVLSDVNHVVPEALLVLACRGEDGRARRLALARLARGPYQGCADTFVEALRSGDDEERSLAIDGLHRLGARDALASAFNDRVDALAAKAALAFVGSRRRLDFVAVLDRYVDPFRRDAILDCLAGLIE